SRSQTHTESKPIRSGSSATCAIAWGDASLPATGRWTTSLTDGIDLFSPRCLLVRTHRAAESHRSAAHGVVGGWADPPGPGATMSPDGGRTGGRAASDTWVERPGRDARARRG